MGQAEERCRVDFTRLHEDRMTLWSRRRIRCRKKKPLRTRTKFVIAAMVNITWYTVAVLFLSWHDHTVPSELTVAWFAAWTAELAILAGITIKSKSSGDDNSDDNSADG